MNRDDVLRTVCMAFDSWPRPKSVTEKVPGDLEREMIESDFGGREASSLDYKECSMMLVDGALVSREAYFYFLPRLAKAVLKEGGNWGLLGHRLDALGTSGLNSKQVEAVACLKSVLDAIEEEMDE